jgi:hypothetical protein
MFELLLPEPHNKVILDLLFEFCTFHSLPKLRLHTETTLRDLENATIRLGQILRTFKNTTCATYETHELPMEEAARGRRQATLSAKCKPTTTTTSTKKKKEFNLETYKFHSLGNYAQSIRMFGATDNTSTQQVNIFYNTIYSQIY